MNAAEALKYSFDTGDRGPFEALLAPECVNWHNHDKLELPAVGNPGAATLRTIVDNLRADIVQHETFPGGEMIRLVIRGTVREGGNELEAHQCIVLHNGEAGIVRIEDYVDPTLGTQLGFPMG
jgi:ketosteroid isomerase-like protein